MKTIQSLILIVSLFAFVACEKNTSIPQSDNLIGYWARTGETESTITFRRTGNLKDNGIAFKAGDVFIDRKNSGFCGTPPISYAEYEGKWTQQESLINITVPFWGGMSVYEWKVVSIKNNELTVSIIKQESKIEKAAESTR